MKEGEYPKGRYAVGRLAAERGYNVHSLTLAAGLAYNTVKGVWHNSSTRADIDTLARIAAVLQVPIGELLESEE